MEVRGQIYIPEVYARGIPGTHTVKMIAIFNYFRAGSRCGLFYEVTSCEYP
jgi:hypothetical protein